MYKAAVNIKLSTDYWEALMANPDSDRQAAVSKTMESVGGKLHFFGFTHGKWDALIAEEAPSEEAFMSALIKAWMAGMIQDIERPFPALIRKLWLPPCPWQHRQIIRNPECDPWRVTPSRDDPFHYITHPKNLGKASNERIYIFVIFGALHFFNKSSWDRFE